MEKSILFNKVAGCLMGGAIGDALGFEVEFLPWQIIHKKYGQLRTLVLHGGKARFSDDTQMTLFTNEGLLTGYWQNKKPGAARPIEEYIHEAYLCWLQTQGEKAPGFQAADSELLREMGLHERRAPGNTCLSALASGRMGRIETPINNSKGCGGVMRSAPAGFMAAWGEPMQVGAASAAVTHGHPGGWVPAGMLSDIVFRCIYEEKKPIGSIVAESIDAVRKKWNLSETERFLEMVEDAIWLSRQDTAEVEAIHAIGGGWVGDEALAIAIYSCRKHPESVAEALITAVNHSGDSDSTGAIAGNILGAYHGLSKIPPEWTEQLELTDVILRQAERMTEAILDYESAAFAPGSKNL